MRLSNRAARAAPALGAVREDRLSDWRLIRPVAFLAVLLSLLLAGVGQPGRAQTDE
jgi:hypothetical protein